MSARLELDRVGVRLDGHDAVRDLSLSVAAGECVVLAGPSGSGKSSLLRAVAGLAPVHTGAIRIGGRDVTALPPGERDVAMVFQGYALFPHLTVRENLAFGLRARGAARASIGPAVQKAAEALELAPLLDRLPRQMSGGERQRVALARALLRQPQAFLLDEPLSSLDAPLRARARAEILRLHRQLESATVYVTHDQAEALAVADRVGLLREGWLEQLGPPQELYSRPRNVFVARFLGNPGMNLLPVKLDGAAAVLGGQRLALPESLARGAATEVLLGVRAEHVHPRGSRWAHELPGAPLLRARVDRIEPGGDQKLLWLEAEGAALAARVEPAFTAAPGASIELTLDPAGLRLFDAASGEALA